MDLQQESLKMHLENHGKMEIRCKAPNASGESRQDGDPLQSASE